MDESKNIVCAYCEKEVADLHRDHVVPRARGGPDNAFNIVMACQQCNSAKRDSLPSEWLGDRCPPAILLIEAKVHAKLKAVFKKRDYKDARTDWEDLMIMLCKTVDSCLRSPNVADSNGETANLVDTTSFIGAKLFYLTKAIKEHGEQVRGGMESVANAIAAVGGCVQNERGDSQP